MRLVRIWILLLVWMGSNNLGAQPKTDATIVGDVQCTNCPDNHIPFANIVILGTTVGGATDATGHFMITNVPVGKHVIKASAIGYQSQEKTFEIKANQTVEIKFLLKEDHIDLENVVVSATRYELDRREAPVMVNIMNDRIFEATRSVSLAEGLGFQPGLRLENNCQNCGFSQVRMNGLQGPYTQILINSRPIFSALQGVYGLDQIPTNMIERVEIVRGGGSALYGSNAIAGTVNIITKAPVMNTYQVSSNYSLIDGRVPERLLNANLSLVSDDLKTGINLYGMLRDHDFVDMNGDGFSEITRMQNNTFGGKAFLKPNEHSKLTLDFHGINDFRRGGNLFDLEPHQTDITEQIDHRIIGGGLAYEFYTNSMQNKWSLYSSLQSIDRKSYYGSGGNLQDFDADQYYTDEDGNFIPLSQHLASELGREPGQFELEMAAQNLRLNLANLAASYYGKTTDLSSITGLQFSRSRQKLNITSGFEYRINRVKDQMPGYNRLIDQGVNNLGIYGQLELKPLKALTILGGLRYDYLYIDGDYNLFETEYSATYDAGVLNPRLNILYKPSKDFQLRASYAKGFRAPQAFDEDLHIETVGGGAQFVRFSQDLEKETSDAFTLSAEQTYYSGKWQFNFLLEGFYTRLYNPFVNVGILEGDDTSPTILEKQNAEEDAVVSGINFESNISPGKALVLQVGGTLQTAKYNQPIEIYAAEDIDGTSIFEENILRTPNLYGYFVGTIKMLKDFQLNLSGNYTGSMSTQYESGLQRPIGIYRTPDFFELNLKLDYNVKVMPELTAVFSTGVQNIFNSFQDDFDNGINRDATYVYGPVRPRTFFIGVKLGSF